MSGSTIALGGIVFLMGGSISQGINGVNLFSEVFIGIGAISIGIGGVIVLGEVIHKKVKSKGIVQDEGVPK